MNKAVSKKKSKTKSGISGVILALLTAVILAVGVLSFVSFEIKGTIYDYNAVIKKINLGIDLEGGAYAVLEPKITDENREEAPKLVGQAIKQFEKRLKIKGFSSGSVTKLSDDRIKIEIPIVDNTEGILKSLASTGSLEFRTTEDGEAALTGESVKSARAAYTVNQTKDAYVPVVVIKFDKEGAKAFTKATEEALSGSKSIYIFLDGEKISTVTVSEKITGSEITIQNANWTAEEAQNMADLFSSGKLGIEFEKIETAMVSSALGAKALTRSLIAGGVILLLAAAGLIVYYKGLGLIGVYSLIINVLAVFLFLTFGKVQLTLSGLAAILGGFALLTGLLSMLFERIRREFANGRIPESAIKHSFRRCLKTILDVLFVLILASLAFFLAGTAAVKSFAVVFIICLVLDGVIALLITRWLFKLFMPLIKNKEKILGLVREDA